MTFEDWTDLGFSKLLALCGGMVYVFFWVDKEGGLRFTSVKQVSFQREWVTTVERISKVVTQILTWARLPII